MSSTEKRARIYWLHALSPLHVGAGRGLGYIDLPLTREKTTNWPYVPASAFKGVLADKHRATEEARLENPLLRAAFGRAGEDHANSGSLVFTDARLVCLPVRSLYGTFAWCTSPLALSRLLRDLQQCRLSTTLPETVDVDVTGLALVPNEPSTVLAEGGRIFFEDLDFTARGSVRAAAWAKNVASWIFPDDASWHSELRKRFCVLHNDVFDFLAETATDVAARVSLSDESKTVADGPWYEESLPSESVLAGLVWCDRVFVSKTGEDSYKKREQITPERLLEHFCQDSTMLQLGGSATVGRGRLNCTFAHADSSSSEESHA